MRIAIFAAAIAAVTLPLIPVAAQTPNQEYRRDVRDAERDRRDAIREADSRGDIRDANREYHKDVRDARDDRRDDRQDNRRDNRQANRDWRGYRNYDYNRLPRGQSVYYADQYYRDGRYYQPRRLSRNDRIYRGRDNRYYCRRSDGTTGLIIGGISGAVLGSAIAGGGSNTLGALLGGTTGALLGRSIDRGQVTCR